MTEGPQVFVDDDLPSYDLDGIGIAGFDDHSHLIQLMIGMAFDSRCVAMSDRNLGTWALMLAPSIILTRDEHEVMHSSVTFKVEPFFFAVPADAPLLHLIKPYEKKDIRLTEIYFWAKQDPFRWFARVKMADGRELICDKKGWCLNGKPAEFRIDLEIGGKYMKSREEHLHTVTSTNFLEGTRPDFPYVLARGQYSPDPNKSERCFLYYRASDHLVFVREAWLAPQDIKRALKYENISAGECDAMYMPAPVLIWSKGTGTFSLFRRLRLLLQISNDGVRVNRYPLNKQMFPRDAVKGIHVYLAQGWVECGVKLVLGERELTLVRNFEWAASADPTYDGFNLLADTAWATSLGRTLSEAIGCPYTADKDLL